MKWHSRTSAARAFWPILVCLSLPVLAGAGESPAATALRWHDDPKAAVTEAMKQKRPILLVAGADWCPPCNVLEKEMQRPEVAGKLSDWTLVHLDVDRSPDAAAWLESGASPLLRVLCRRASASPSAMGRGRGKTSCRGLPASANRRWPPRGRS